MGTRLKGPLATQQAAPESVEDSESIRETSPNAKTCQLVPVHSRIASAGHVVTMRSSGTAATTSGALAAFL